MTEKPDLTEKNSNSKGKTRVFHHLSCVPVSQTPWALAWDDETLTAEMILGNRHFSIQRTKVPQSSQLPITDICP